MIDNGVAFVILENNQQVPEGWRKLSGRLVFDIKIDFKLEDIWVLDGHKNPFPTISTYSGVVPIDSIWNIFTYATLNDVDIWVADIKNAYLQTSSSQKDFTIYVLEPFNLHGF